MKSVTAEVHVLKAKMAEIEKKNHVVFTSKKFDEREKTLKEMKKSKR